LQYTTSGPGSPAHLLMTGFSKQEKFEVTHIPYKGSNPALMDTVAGRVGVMLVEASSAVPHVRTGALRALACISPGRAPLMPDLKTSTELGFPNLVMDSSFGMIAPPGTPVAILNRLGTALQQATKKADFVELQRTAGNAIDFVAGTEYRARLMKDHERWAQVVKSSGISLQ
jgi:tripartite-type tricarboxylate transporter receptor subunit TctC